MKSITKIYIALAFFTYIISCSVIYMILSNMYSKRHKNKVKMLDDTFKKDILKQLDDTKNNREVSKINIIYTRYKIRKRVYKDSFHNALFEFNKDYNNHKYTKIYIKNFEDIIISDIKKYNKRDETIKSHYIMLLGEYKLSNIEINDFLYDCLDTKSTQLRTLALKSISKIGNLNNLIKAIRYISDKQKYINSRMFMDIIDIFCGNKRMLNMSLINMFNEFNHEIQRVIIGHFKNNKVEYVKSELLDILIDEKAHKEVKIAIIKYFSFIKYEKVTDTLISIVNHSDWEYRAVGATALGNYPSKKTIEVLQLTITDKNWYVRYNSAMSLLELYGDYIDDIILSQNDKYSRDILFYAMFTKERISYERYLEEIGDVAYSC